LAKDGGCPQSDRHKKPEKKKPVWSQSGAKRDLKRERGGNPQGTIPQREGIFHPGFGKGATVEGEGEGSASEGGHYGEIH